MSIRLHDISPPVSAEIQVWPGDTPPSRQVLLDIRRGNNITLSSLHSTVHLGSHADAPSHYGHNARTIEQQPLELYVGPCSVIHASVKRGERVSIEHVLTQIEDQTSLRSMQRLLIGTGTYPDPTKWNDDFAGLEPSLVDYLHNQGVRLVGIDTPSVDLFSSKDLPAHQRFLAHDMAILEGLLLHAVPAGVYELIALPLRLVGFDASPVRAVLRELS